MGKRRCSRCGGYFGEDKFYWDKRGRYSSRCKGCEVEASREWSRRNRERSLANRRRWREANEGYYREYYREHREELAKRARERYWRGREHVVRVKMDREERLAERRERRFAKRWEERGDEITDWGRWYEMRAWERVERGIERENGWPAGLKRCGLCGEWKTVWGFIYLRCRECYLERAREVSKQWRAEGKVQRKGKPSGFRVRRVNLALGLKICKVCGIEKKLEEFYRCSKMSDGRTGVCGACLRERNRVWRSEHRGRIRDWNRFVRLRRSEARAVEFDMDRWIEVQRPLKCYYCGKKIEDEEYHIDHFIPLVKGGSHAPWNLRVACPGCNHSKRDKMPWEFDEERFVPSLLL